MIMSFILEYNEQYNLIINISYFNEKGDQRNFTP